jgi:hypothetical protein
VVAAAAESVAPIVAIRCVYPASRRSLVTGGRSILSGPTEKQPKAGAGKEFLCDALFPRCAVDDFLAISARFPVGVKRP